MPPEIEYVKGGFYEGRKKFRYRIDGQPANSVTEILDWVFGKGKFGAGSWWGQGVGVEGVAKLHADGFDVPWDDPKAIVQLLTANKLTTNHTRDAAADRGSAIHAAAELWAKERVVPNPADFQESERGYVRALALFLTEYQPEFLATEVVVGSAEHLYAGTYDVRARIGDRIGLLDYKTSKRVYTSHFMQLAMYERAAIECGAEPTDFRGVIWLGNGEFDLVESPPIPDEWIDGLLAWYRGYQGLEAASKEKLKRAA